MGKSKENINFWAVRVYGPRYGNDRVAGVLRELKRSYGDRLNKAVVRYYLDNVAATKARFDDAAKARALALYKAQPLWKRAIATLKRWFRIA